MVSRSMTWTNSTLVRSGKSGSCSTVGADAGDVHRLGVGDDEDAVRVAHADRARGRRGGAGRRGPSRGRAAPRPSAARGGPMLTRVRPSPASSAWRMPRPVRRSRARAPALGHQHARDAAGGVAAGVGEAAVGVPEVDLGGDPEAGAHHRELVEADAAVAVAEGAGERRRHRSRRPVLGAGVDHDEVVAEPVHLQEPEIAGLTIRTRFAIHAPLYRRGSRARPWGRAGRNCGLTAGIPALRSPPALGPVAQSVEQLTFNQWVTGSNPVGLTKA